MVKQAALTSEEFEKLMEGFPTPPSHMAVACSGGPDSLALTFLMQEWLEAKGAKLTALIVDHRLRAESGKEAAEVADQLTQLGISVNILTHEGRVPERDIQNKARDIRYGLLKAWCQDHQVHDLALGHHLDDQAETFLIRLARGSGVDGLAAMKPLSQNEALTLWRPLLTIPKSRLVAMLVERELDFVQDPSNQKPDYTRNRMRQFMPQLAEEGLSSQRLANTAEHMARASDALDHYVNLHLARSGRLFHSGYARLDQRAFLNAPEEILLRSLGKLLRVLGGNPYPERFEKLFGLLVQIRHWGEGDGATLAGCQLMRNSNQIWIARERQAGQAMPVSETGTGIWDGRLEIQILVQEMFEQDMRVDFLGPEGLALVRGQEGYDAEIEALPGFVRQALPALWQGDRVLSLLGGRKSDQAQGYGIEQIRLIGADFFGKTAFSSAPRRTM